MLTPKRRYGHEILDDPDVDPDVVRRSMQDVARSNHLFGGVRAAIGELDDVLVQATGPMSVLDVGTGIGDILGRARIRATELGVSLRTAGLDSAEELTRVARGAVDDAICGDALALPFRDGSFDIVICSQVLHHFWNGRSEALIREMERVARQRVIIADLRRSWFAVAGLWLSSFLLGFHPVSRHDGVVSLLRGFTPEELTRMVQSATGTTPRVRTFPMFRVTASWAPGR
jgi:SAM-dependent methyltransferase